MPDNDDLNKDSLTQIFWVGVAGISGLEGIGLPGKFGANELGYNQIAGVKWLVDNASRSSPLFDNKYVRMCIYIIYPQPPQALAAVSQSDSICSHA